jgi:phosphatidylserine decarboxylase
MQFAHRSPRYAAIPAALALPAVLWPPLSAALLLAAVGVLWFHRDPDRTTPPTGIVSPADGHVTKIRKEASGLRVAIYMRGRDVHVNRAPMSTVVESVDHEPGSNKLAFRKESEHNERLRFSFEDYTAEMIAGAFARRTYSYVDPGENVERGQRIGHISFSSRFDVVLPPEYDRSDLTVAEGNRVLAGETVIARPRSAVEN